MFGYFCVILGLPTVSDTFLRCACVYFTIINFLWYFVLFYVLNAVSVIESSANVSLMEVCVGPF